MKSKRTNILLGIIATCLVLLTLIQLEIWPTNANANEIPNTNNSIINSDKYTLYEYDGKLLLLNTETGRIGYRLESNTQMWYTYMPSR